MAAGQGGAQKPVMNFFSDLVDIARDKLIEAGYAPAGMSVDDTLRAYLNVAHRRVPVRKRTTHRAKAFSCPPEHQAGLDQLLQKSESGGDLRPNQSTSLDRQKFNDAVLNDWAIHHFHL